jgi:hypothetical protein
MRFFTRDWCNGEMADEESEKVVSNYWSYFDSISEKFPYNILDFAKEISIHDGLIRRIIVDRKLTSVHLLLRCGNLQDSYFDLDISNSGVVFNLSDISAFESLSKNNESEILYDEFDIESNRLYVHRIIFHPEHEISVIFSSFSYLKTSKSSREFDVQTPNFQIL